MLKVYDSPKKGTNKTFRASSTTPVISPGSWRLLLCYCVHVRVGDLLELLKSLNMILETILVLVYYSIIRGVEHSNIEDLGP